jgi:hypothetical protein
LPGLARDSSKGKLKGAKLFEHQDGPVVAELFWEIKRRLKPCCTDFKQISDEKSAKMFCFAWGIPEEILYFWGKDTLSVPWNEIERCLWDVSTNYFWNGAIEVYQNFLKIIELRYFSPYLNDSNGLFETVLAGDKDPNNSPVLYLKLYPGINKFSYFQNDININLILKFLHREIFTNLPTKKEGSHSSFWYPTLGKDPIYTMKFRLDDYSNNHYKLSKKKIEESFIKVYKQFDLLPKSPRISKHKAKRISKTISNNSYIDPLRCTSLSKEIISNLNNQKIVDEHFIVDDQTIKRDLMSIHELSKNIVRIALKKKSSFSFELAI